MKPLKTAPALLCNCNLVITPYVNLRPFTKGEITNKVAPHSIKSKTPKATFYAMLPALEHLKPLPYGK
jgi:hypothetical protein